MQTKYSKSIHDMIIDLLPGFHRFINPIVNKAEFNGTKLLKNQIKIIAVLNLEERLTPGQISIMLDIQKGSLTRMLKALLDLNLISRDNDQNDDRKYYLTLTDSGKNFYRAHQENCDRKLSRLFAEMNISEKNAVEDGLKIIHSYFNNIGGDNEKR